MYNSTSQMSQTYLYVLITVYWMKSIYVDARQIGQTYLDALITVYWIKSTNVKFKTHKIHLMEIHSRQRTLQKKPKISSENEIELKGVSWFTVIKTLANIVRHQPQSENDWDVRHHNMRGRLNHQKFRQTINFHTHIYLYL